jgi:hypothetical protein
LLTKSFSCAQTPQSQNDLGKLQNGSVAKAAPKWLAKWLGAPAYCLAKDAISHDWFASRSPVFSTVANACLAHAATILKKADGCFIVCGVAS